MLRYDNKQLIVTNLDPIEDILNFIITLKSSGFTADLLNEIHGFTNSAEVKSTSRLIALHVDNAIGLANQGFDGPPQYSFLPLYYSTLNMMKVYLLFLGKRQELERNRWHGAKYSESEMTRQFLNEKIHIKNRGTIPITYTTITGKTISNSGIDLTLQELYQNISSISAEYITVTKQKVGFMAHSSEFIKDDANGHYLKIQILDDFKNTPPSPRKLQAYPTLRLVDEGNNNIYYATRRIKGNYDTVKRSLESNVKRYLNSDTNSDGDFWYSNTPINGRFHVFNEELSIMLAYFHLSNVVRYNPEHLYKLMDSKYWAIMLGLRRHGFLQFLKLMWGNYNKKSFDIY